VTKVRAPLTFELAMAKIAGEIGWEKIADISGQAVSTLYNWSNPDSQPTAGDSVSLSLALKLDAAYRAAGGEGAPLLQCLGLKLDAETLVAIADSAAIVRSIATAAKEGGEAIAASIAAAQPGASPQERARAELELEESIAAQTNTLVSLRTVRTDEVKTGARAQSPGGE
jgi:hypothetical protein